MDIQEKRLPLGTEIEIVDYSDASGFGGGYIAPGGRYFVTGYWNYCKPKHGHFANMRLTTPERIFGFDILKNLSRFSTVNDTFIALGDLRDICVRVISQIDVKSDREFEDAAINKTVICSPELEISKLTASRVDVCFEADIGLIAVLGGTLWWAKRLILHGESYQKYDKPVPAYKKVPAENFMLRVQCG